MVIEDSDGESLIPMKSAEVHSTIGQVVGPWCKAQGFTRTKSGCLGFFKPMGDTYLLFFVQLSKYGWNPFTGNDFVVEFQLWPDPRIARGHSDSRQRLSRHLDARLLEEARRIQNVVIAGLPPLPPGQMTTGVASSEIAPIHPVGKPYAKDFDVWMRYLTEDDVRRWAEFLLEQLPRIVAGYQLLAQAPQNPRNMN